jgi:DnaJ-class molecular chaperone
VGEAYDGASVDVPTPDGNVRLKVPPRSQQGTELRLRGKGVQRGSDRGDLYVKLEVRLPDEDTPAVRQAVQAMSGAYTRPPREGIRL